MRRFYWDVRLGRLLIVVALAFTTCSGESRGAHDTLPPPPPSSTTTTITYDVPATIDQAYVEKVMKALDHVYGDAIRELKQTGQADAQFQLKLGSIYADHYYRLALQGWAKEVTDGLRGIADKPGDPVTTITRLLRSDRECIVAEVKRDLQPLHSRPVIDTPQPYIALVPLPKERGVGSTNPTPWMMSYDGFRSDGSEPPDPCNGT